MMTLVLVFLMILFPQLRLWTEFSHSTLRVDKKLGLNFCLKMIHCFPEKKLKQSGPLELLVMWIQLSLPGPCCGLNNGATQLWLSPTCWLNVLSDFSTVMNKSPSKWKCCSSSPRNALLHKTIAVCCTKALSFLMPSGDFQI